MLLDRIQNGRIERPRKTAEAPALRVPNRAAHRPWPWKRGSVCTSRSSGVHPQASRKDSVFASRFAWVSTAPLGAPVVPDVNPIRAGASGWQPSTRSLRPSPPEEARLPEGTGLPEDIWQPEGSRTVTLREPRADSSARIARNRSSVVIAASGLTSFATWRSSRSESAVSTGTSTSPARSTPRQATIEARDLSALQRTLDPASSPKLARLRATSRERSSNSPAVTQRAESSGPPLPLASKRVGLPGSAAHCRAHASGRDPAETGSNEASKGPASKEPEPPDRPPPRCACQGSGRTSVEASLRPMPRHVAIVPHTHWDREWYEPYQSFRMSLVDMLDKLIPLLERDPSYARFMLDGQMAVVDDYLEVRPEAESRLRALAATGRLAMGPWYALMDEFLISGETIIRDLQLGFARGAAFGGVMEVGYLPDMFGHVAQMPQILRLAGFEHAVVWRGVPSAVEQSGFCWQAPDGSSVRAEYLMTGYGNGAAIGDDAKALVSRIHDHIEEVGSFLIDGLLFMNGTDHQEPQPWLGRVVAEANAIQDDYDIEITSLADYLAEGTHRWTRDLAR